MSPHHSNRRSRRLIRPAFQWRIVLVFLSMACVAVLVQATALNLLLYREARALPVDGDLLLERAPRVLLVGLLCGAAVLVPLMVVTGLLVTFRIAGPIHRMEQHLRALLRGEASGPCRIRAGDEFQDLSALLNEYLERQPRGERAAAPRELPFPPALLPGAESEVPPTRSEAAVEGVTSVSPGESGA